MMFGRSGRFTLHCMDCYHVSLIVVPVWRAKDFGVILGNTPRTELVTHDLPVRPSNRSFLLGSRFLVIARRVSKLWFCLG